MSFRKTTAQIDLAALRRNCKVLAERAAPGFFCPMVKANAYGHGAVTVVRELQKLGIQNFGVALIEEGIELRQAGFAKERFYVFGVFDPQGARAVIEHRLTPVVSRMDQLESLMAALPSNAHFPIHVKFNTGMNRLGFAVADAPAVAALLKQTSKLNLEGLCTHLACGDDIGNSQGRSQTQLAQFEQAVRLFPTTIQHVYNSASLLGSEAVRYGTRPGISLYGERPSDKTPAVSLEPVMTFRSEIVMIHRLKIGESVSYGARWTAQRPSVVATVAVGYADGLNRALAHGGEMLYRGQRVPIAGTVCMDYTMIDITDAVTNKAPQVGEEVVIFGKQQGQFLKASEVASRLGTISYEVFVNISARVPREPK